MFLCGGACLCLEGMGTSDSQNNKHLLRSCVEWSWMPVVQGGLLCPHAGMGWNRMAIV